MRSRRTSIAGKWWFGESSPTFAARSFDYADYGCAQEIRTFAFAIPGISRATWGRSRTPGTGRAWRAGRSRILCSAGCVPASAEVARCSKRTLERSRMPWLGASSGPRNSTSCSRAARRFDYAGVSPNTPASLVKSTLPTIPARKAHTRPSPTGHNTSNARRASLCRRTQGTASRPRQRCQLIVNAIRLIPTRIRANKCADTGSMLRR